MTTIIAKYVGLKPEEMDCVANTGLVWVGLGAEHEVSAEAAAIMARHPDVWELIEREDALATGKTLSDAARDKVPDGTTDLTMLDRNALYALAVERGLKPHAKLGKDKLLALLEPAKD